MKLGKYYLEEELNGATYGRAEGGGLREIKEPKAYITEHGDYYTSIEETEAYEAELDNLDGFDTIEEAERAAEGLIAAKTPYLKITTFLQWDEAATYTKNAKRLTNAYGEKIEKEN